jgi:signal transduction histidine kinase
MKKTIFERDRRNDKSLIGIGLGLSLVKRIVNSYGGKIRVNDRVQGNYQEGSCFVILLPAYVE